MRDVGLELGEESCEFFLGLLVAREGSRLGIALFHGVGGVLDHGWQSRVC